MNFDSWTDRCMEGTEKSSMRGYRPEVFQMPYMENSFGTPRSQRTYHINERIRGLSND